MVTYLNTPTSGLLSSNVLIWRREHDLAFLMEKHYLEKQQNLFAATKQSLAGLFNADPSYTFLSPNFSFAFNTLLEGLSKDERVLLLEEDYPSVNYAVRSRGFNCETVNVDEHLENRILDKIQTFRPTVFAFSIVQYLSGIKLDLAFIKELKRLYPSMLLIADGTQYCGTEAFDFKNSGLDVLGSSGYKWMMAGYGNGFLFLRESLINRLYREEQRRATPTEPFLKDKRFPAHYFEPGHQDSLAFGTLHLAVSNIEKLSLKKIKENIQALSAKAKEEFTERGIISSDVSKRGLHSSIFNLSLNDAQYHKLHQAGISCAQRGKGVRVGFHYFNTEGDLSRLLEVLDGK